MFALISWYLPPKSLTELPVLPKLRSPKFANWTERQTAKLCKQMTDEDHFLGANR